MKSLPCRRIDCGHTFSLHEIGGRCTYSQQKDHGFPSKDCPCTGFVQPCPNRAEVMWQSKVPSHFRPQLYFCSVCRLDDDVLARYPGTSYNINIPYYGDPRRPCDNYWSLEVLNRRELKRIKVPIEDFRG